MGKGSGTTETTQQTSYAPWISGAQQAAAGIGLAQNLPFLQHVPEFARAGFNMDQHKGFDLVRDTVGQYGGGAGRTMTPLSMGGGMGMNAASSQAAQAQGAQAGPVQLGANEFKPFMDPYLSTVGDRTMDVMRRERDNTNAAADARAAGMGAFGGSGAAIEKALNNRNFLTEGARMEAGLQSNAFNTANQLAQGNAQMRQQSELENAGLRQQAALENAGLRQQTALSNAGFQQDANRSNLDNFYRMIGLEDAMKNSDLDRQMAIFNSLLGVGDYQQRDAQKTLDIPHDALQRLFQYIPQAYDVMQTGTQPDNSPDMLQQLLGAALTVGGMGTGGGGTLLGSLLGGGGSAFPVAPGGAGLY